MGTKNCSLINGVSYEISKGMTLVDGTGYELDNGNTLVNGTSYEIPLISTFNVNLVGVTNENKAYISINGVKYADSPQIVEVDEGAEIECYVYYDGTYQHVGNNVLNAENAYVYHDGRRGAYAPYYGLVNITDPSVYQSYVGWHKYEFVVDANIEIKFENLTYSNVGRIRITTK